MKGKIVFSKPDDRPASKSLLAFGPFELDLQRAVLLRDGTELPLRPKCFDVLRYLVEHNRSLVTKDELLAAVWPGLVVSDTSLSQCVLEIRRALDPDGRSLVRTVPRRGYCFEAQVKMRPAVAPLEDRTAERSKSRTWLGVSLAMVLVVFGLAMHQREPPGFGAQQQASAAYQQYLLGTYFQDRRSPGDLERSIGYFRHATQLDPELADAWVGLAGSIFLSACMSGRSEFQDWKSEFKSALDQALELEPDNPEANARIAKYYIATGQSDLARTHLQKAMQHGEDNAMVLGFEASEALEQRDLKRAVELQGRVVVLKPRSYSGQSNLGIYLFLAGDLVLARQHLQIARDLNPDGSSQLDATLLQAMVLMGDHPAVSKLAALISKGPDREQAMAFVYEVRGDEAQRDRHLNNLAADSSALAALRLAEFNGYLGQWDKSRYWLLRALILESREIPEQYFHEFVNEVRFSPFLQHSFDETLLAEAEKLSGA